MDALELLVGRESATKLSAPGPDQDALDKMFQSALRAPDHGRLRPWRFVVVPEERRERFGELMADCLRRMEPGAPADALQRERDKAMRAPVIVVDRGAGLRRRDEAGSRPRSGQRDRRVPVSRHAGRRWLAGGEAAGARPRLGVGRIVQARAFAGTAPARDASISSIERPFVSNATSQNAVAASAYQNARNRNAGTMPTP